MNYLGDYVEDDTLYFLWSTNDTSGASITRATDGTISVYKDNGLTQSTAGITDTEDFDSLTGIHACTIDLSADAFYAIGADYSVVLSGASIDGQTVNAVIAQFSIENRTAKPKADYPSNFADLSITASTGRVDVASIEGSDATDQITASVPSATDIVDEWESQSQADPTGFHVNVLEIGGTAQTANDNGADINAILIDTNELQLNQGNWLTATGFAVAGDQMNLADDAITSAKFDESTAFPITSADTGATEIARTGADGDTLETLSDQIDGVPLAVRDVTLVGTLPNNTLGKTIRDVQEYEGYQGYIWIDTNNGTAGTDSYINGTSNNPVDSIADALTLSAAVGIIDFKIATGSSITFPSSMDGYSFYGTSWVCTLNGQSLSGTYIENAVVLGNDSGTNANATIYSGCRMSTNTLGYHRCTGCGLFGTVTLSESASYGYVDCHHSTPTGTYPIISFGAAVGDTNLNIVNWDGQIEIQQLGANGTDTLGIDGSGAIILNANCVGGTIRTSGTMTLTDNSTGTTIDNVARVDNTSVNAQVVDVMATDTITLPVQGAPSATPTRDYAVGLLYKALRNKTETTATALNIYNDAGDTVDHAAVLSDDGTTASKGEIGTGA